MAEREIGNKSVSDDETRTIYDSEFFKTLKMYFGRNNIVYVFASSERVHLLLSRAFHSEDALRDFNLYNLVLGPVSQEEAIAYLKKELQLSLGEMERIIETAGRYPLFLRVATMYVKAQIAEDRHYELTEVTAEKLKEWLYGKRVEGGLYEDYKEIWDSLSREEQRVLYRLVEEPWLVVEDDEIAKSLVKNKGVIDRPFGNKTIPAAFADFIKKTSEFAPMPTHERLWNLLWPLKWDKSRTISAMFVLLIFYAIATPIVLNWPNVPLGILAGVPAGFVVLLICLILLYFRAPKT